jgi:small-conductance mechanosensitive channel
VLTFLDGGILLRAYIWTNNPTDAFDLKCDVNKTIKEMFDKEGIALANLQYQIKSV